MSASQLIPPRRLKPGLRTPVGPSLCAASFPVQTIPAVRRARGTEQIEGTRPPTGRPYQVQRKLWVLLARVLLLLLGGTAGAAGPVVANVRAAQRAGTKLVEISYDVAGGDSALTVGVQVSTNGGASYSLPATSFSGAGFGSGILPGNGRRIVWDAGADWNGQFSANVRFRVTATDQPPAPSGLALIPAGSFQMGNALSATGDGDSRELPVHSVYVSAFYMDRTPVTKAGWDDVHAWAITHGYSFDNSGSYYNGTNYSKGPTHPVHSVNWWDCVKWCNARSEKEGRIPAYYTNANQSAVYRTGRVDVQNGFVKWTAGYRLPTEAEWEKAARGGLSGRRFPWGDTITNSQANYYSYRYRAYTYDLSPTWGFNPAYNDNVQPYTSPVGSFAANGYGLYDMAGNVRNWCWDWDGPYSSGAQSNPQGPASGSRRVFRGGNWLNDATVCRSASRDGFYPYTGYNNLGDGFRSVRPRPPPSVGEL